MNGLMHNQNENQLKITSKMGHTRIFKIISDTKEVDYIDIPIGFFESFDYFLVREQFFFNSNNVLNEDNGEEIIVKDGKNQDYFDKENNQFVFVIDEGLKMLTREDIEFLILFSKLDLDFKNNHFKKHISNFINYQSLLIDVFCIALTCTVENTTIYPSFETRFEAYMRIYNLFGYIASEERKQAMVKMFVRSFEIWFQGCESELHDDEKSNLVFIEEDDD